MEVVRDAYEIPVGMPEGKTPLRRPRHECMNLKCMSDKLNGMDKSASG
jgi:hypothetical protein